MAGPHASAIGLRPYFFGVFQSCLPLTRGKERMKSKNGKKQENAINGESLLDTNIFCPQCRSEMNVRIQKKEDEAANGLILLFYGNIITMRWTDLNTLTYDVSDKKASVPFFRNGLRVHLRSPDDTELDDECPEAKKYVSRRLACARKIELKNIGRGKNSRIIADVCIDGSSLADELISGGYRQSL